MYIKFCLRNLYVTDSLSLSADYIFYQGRILKLFKHFAVYIDLTAAYDSVWRQSLKNKLVYTSFFYIVKKQCN